MSNTLSNIANEEELAVVHSKDVVNILSYIHTTYIHDIHDILDQQKVLEKNRSELKNQSELKFNQGIN
jgi:hypothetical protein